MRERHERHSDTHTHTRLPVRNKQSEHRCAVARGVRLAWSMCGGCPGPGSPVCGEYKGRYVGEKSHTLTPGLPGTAARRCTQSHLAHSSMRTVSGLHHSSQPAHGTPMPAPGREQSLPSDCVASSTSTLSGTADRIGSEGAPVVRSEITVETLFQIWLDIISRRKGCYNRSRPSP